MQDRDRSARTRHEWEQRVGAQIRALRRRRGLAQADLARLANLDRTTVSRIERGAGGSIGSLVDLARALDRTDWLEALATPEPGVSPLALLHEHQATAPARVR